ncbi:unnamed protein product, partial [Thlaspi arvense]
MKNFMQLICTFFFVAILFTTPGVKMVQGQRMCEAKSLNFRGMCMKWRTCKFVCLSEGFTDGRCEGFIRHCICRKPCMVST